MKPAFPEFLDRLLLFGGAVAFLAVLAGCLLVGLSLLCSLPSRSREPGD